MKKSEKYANFNQVEYFFHFYLSVQIKKYQVKVMLNALKEFRARYLEMRKALPFLDCYVSDLPCEWDLEPEKDPLPSVKLSFETGNPRLVMQTEHSFAEIEEMARKEPEINFILASGNKKMLYHIEELTRLIRTYPNIYLATGNVCNVYALEDLVRAGCKDKLLYGTMAPYLDPGQALGPVILGRFDWETRCAIAGNNLRRLLGEKPVLPAELPEIKIPALIIDAHGHTTNPESPTRFPAPDSAPVWAQWQPKMEFFGLTDFFVTPGETIADVAVFPGHSISDFCRSTGGRIRYFEGFDPRNVEASLKALEKSLPDPMCIGIKIHPPEHRTDADVPEYDQVFQMAAKYNKPIMTHSWGLSDYNPNQRHATPDRFECWLKKYPGVSFVFGHTGGRPNGFIQAVGLFKKYPQCMGDLAGDLFNNQFLLHAVKEIGADRLMFGSDMYWIDPRCMLGMVLELDISTEDMLKILRGNAEKFYLSRG